MNMLLSTTSAMSDEQLWQLACDGDRDAFSRIVERYQRLICSLAYSACGALGTSEDMAQETFITAWHRLKELREPNKLRQWLCGILRNIAASAARRELRRGGAPESLEVVADEASPMDDPAGQAVTREEETLLWRTLAEMPESYREPLVLFYREERSIAEVATQLDLSEDTVKQRLSRGRALLREEMAALIESTLERTKPGAAFTLAVLAALPMISASSASAALTAGAIANSSAGTAGKGILAKLGLGAFAGPLIGLGCAWFGTKAAASTARSEKERDCILRHARYRIVVFCWVMSIGLALVLTQAGKLYTPSAGWLVLGISAWVVALVGGIMLMVRRLNCEVERIRITTNTTDAAYAKTLAAQGKQFREAKYLESETRPLGLPLFAIVLGAGKSDRNERRVVCGWIAVGDVAVSPFLAFGGIAIAPIAVGAITAGVLSLSVFWGVAVGVFALGSLAFGWWAVGCAAAGWKLALGFAAVARDYAVGIVTSATEANTHLAKEWLRSQWLADFTNLIIHQAHWWILGIIIVTLVLNLWRKRQSARHATLASSASER